MRLPFIKKHQKNNNLCRTTDLQWVTHSSRFLLSFIRIHQVISYAAHSIRSDKLNFRTHWKSTLYSTYVHWLTVASAHMEGAAMREPDRTEEAFDSAEEFCPRSDNTVWRHWGCIWTFFTPLLPTGFTNSRFHLSIPPIAFSPYCHNNLYSGPSQ